MHFHKHPHPANFEFPPLPSSGTTFLTASGKCRMTSTVAENGVQHLQITSGDWKHSDSDAGIEYQAAEKSAPTRTADRLEWSLPGLKLASPADRFFGQCGEAWAVEFDVQESDRFYGFGEKWTGFEHSGRAYQFWNTDVWADFHPESYIKGLPAPDPVYVSIPYVVLKRGNVYAGLLLDNPHASFISVGTHSSIAGQMDLGDTKKVLRMGSREGQPNLYLIPGPSLAEVTRRLQTLVGRTPLPPAWSLGYHQCRWGYQSEEDLEGLDSKFREHEIPVDGLWLDIEYMEGYRVFTWAKKNFASPTKTFAKLAERGRKVVPIIDPGVKNEPGYSIYDRGNAAGAFCQNPQGKNYVGLVWPGETVFPDFSLKSARDWWANEVADFGRMGILGAWLDMNDPSTGPVDNAEMLFNHGRKSHSSYHNQYALGMARATRDGFLAAHPEKRPFLLSRSGFIGTSRCAAIWTGDNYSNYHHLKNCIPTTLNLALSGIPFNGPDAGGFGGDTTPELICDWFKACFLFPFFRNHTITGSRPQEPWAFDKTTLNVLRRYIQLRYRLRPYLYQLFAEQELSGEAILRPLFYDFQDTQDLPLEAVDDQFMVGPSIMQAPFVQEKQSERKVVLPAGTTWYSLADNCWHQGGQVLEVSATRLYTPLYIRDGSVLPLARIEPADHRFNATRIDFDIYLQGDGEASTRYVFDDGESFGYQKGKRSEVKVVARRNGTQMAILLEHLSQGFGAGDFTYSTDPKIKSLTVNGKVAKIVEEQGVRLGSKARRTWSV